MSTTIYLLSQIQAPADYNNCNHDGSQLVGSAKNLTTKETTKKETDKGESPHDLFMRETAYHNTQKTRPTAGEDVVHYSDKLDSNQRDLRPCSHVEEITQNQVGDPTYQ